MSFVPYDRPVRAAFIGLGRIYDLNVRAYAGNPDVEVVALVDPDEERRAQRRADWPAARVFASAAELAASGIGVDAAEVLLPIPLHADGVSELLSFGWHVNMQKPMCNDLAEARRILDAAQAHGRVLRVMENYLFYEPLRKLKAVAESAEIGEVSGYHMKMTGTGQGGWEVPVSSFLPQLEQMQRGRGVLVFDDGWHKLSTALWLFGPVREVRRRAARLSRARRRLGQQLPRLRPPLAPLAAHRRRPAVLERRGSRRRAALRPGRLREQRRRRHRRKPRAARVGRAAPRDPVRNASWCRSSWPMTSMGRWVAPDSGRTACGRPAASSAADIRSVCATTTLSSASP
jgi:hypothetical protein